MSGVEEADYVSATTSDNVVVDDQPKSGAGYIYGRKSSEELKQIARKELNEVQPECNLALVELRSWMRGNPHVKGYTDNDVDVAVLLAYLRSCKYDTTEARKNLKKLYELKLKVPAWFRGRDFNKSLELIQLGIAVACGYGEKGELIGIFKSGCYNPGEYKSDVVVASGMLVTDCYCIDEQASVCGVVGILDCQDFGISHLALFTPPVLMKLATFVNVCPFIIQKLHVINLSPGFKYVADFVLKLLNSNLRQKVIIHESGFEVLLEHFPRSCLPLEYGGTAGPLDYFIDMTIARLSKVECWLI